MAGNWLRLECKGVLLGWTSELPPAEYAAWIKLLQVVKAFGEVGGRIKSAHFDESLMSKLHMSQRAFDNTITKGLEAGAIVRADGYITITAWKRYQIDPRARDRKAAQRAKTTEDVTGTPGSHGCHDDGTLTGRDGTGRDGTTTEPVDVAVADPDDHRFAGAFHPDREAVPPAELDEARRYLMACWREANIGELPDFDAWLKKLARNVGGGHNLLPYARTFQVDDFQRAWIAFNKRKKREQTWTGTWVVNARTRRRSDQMGVQEAEAEKARRQDGQDTANMSDDMKAVVGQVVALTDDEKRDIAWGQLSNVDKTPLIAAVRAELDGAGTFATVEHTAKVRWWEEHGEHTLTRFA